MRRSKISAWIAAALWLLLCVPTAFAAENGSLKIEGVTEAVQIYQILDENGAPAPSFAGAQTLLENISENPVTAARNLAEYAAAQSCESLEKEPENDNTAFYQVLPLGMYLVCSSGGEFSPFLLEIPTVINGQAVYTMEAKPKIEETPEETVPVTTVPAQPENTDAAIPQTGVSVIPKYVLMCLGTVITLWGLWDLLRGREEVL